MSDAAVTSPRTWKRPPSITSPVLRWTLIIGAVIYLIAAFATIEVNWSRVYEGLERGWKFVVAFTNPDFGSRASDIKEGMRHGDVGSDVRTISGIINKT